MRHVVLELVALWVAVSVPVAFVLGRWMMQPKTAVVAAVEAPKTAVAV